MTFVLSILAVALLAFLLSEPWRRSPRADEPDRPRRPVAYGLWFAVMHPDRLLARQRWQWDADEDLPPQRLGSRR